MELLAACCDVHPLGSRITVSWSLDTATLADSYRVVLFRKLDSAVTAGEVAAFLASGTHTGLRVIIFNSAETRAEGWQGTDGELCIVRASDTRMMFDANVTNGRAYHYAVVAEDLSTHVLTDVLYGSATPGVSMSLETFESKKLLVLALRQFVIDVGNMTPDKDVFIAEEFSNLEEHDPQISVHRLGAPSPRNWIGDMGDASAQNDVIGAEQSDVYLVTWQSKTVEHVELLYRLLGAGWIPIKDFLTKQGATDVKFQMGAEEQLTRDDAPYARRGSMTVTIEHSAAQITMVRPEARAALSVTFTPEGGTLVLPPTPTPPAPEPGGNMRIPHQASIHEVNFVTYPHVIKRWDMSDFYSGNFHLVGLRVNASEAADGEWSVLVTAHGIDTADKTYELTIGAGAVTAYKDIDEKLLLANYHNFDIAVCLVGDVGDDNPQDVDIELVSYDEA